MERVASVIDLWPSPPDFARDMGVPLTKVHVWKHRGWVPPEFWSRIEQEARRRGIPGASASDLAQTAAAQRGVA